MKTPEQLARECAENIIGGDALIPFLKPLADALTEARAETESLRNRIADEIKLAPLLSHCSLAYSEGMAEGLRTAERIARGEGNDEDH